MNRWRLANLLLVLISLLLLLASTWFGWEPWGSFRFIRPDWQSEAPFFHRFSQQNQANTLLRALGAFVTLYLGGVLVLFAFPERVRRMQAAFSTQLAGLGRLVLLGLLATLLLAAVGLGSAMSTGTFPLTFILAGLLYLSGFLGFIALAYTLGRSLFRNAGWEAQSPMYALLLGLLVLYALMQIPILGDALKVIFVSLGVGATLLTHFGSGQPWSLAPLLEEDKVE